MVENSESFYYYLVWLGIIVLSV